MEMITVGFLLFAAIKSSAALGEARKLDNGEVVLTN